VQSQIQAILSHEDIFTEKKKCHLDYQRCVLRDTIIDCRGTLSLRMRNMCWHLLQPPVNVSNPVMNLLEILIQVPFS